MSDQSKTPPAKDGTVAPAAAVPAAVAAPKADVSAKAEKPDATTTDTLKTEASKTVLAQAADPVIAPVEAKVVAKPASKPVLAKSTEAKSAEAKPAAAKPAASKPTPPKMAKPAAKTAAPKATKPKSAVTKTPVAAKVAALVKKKESIMTTTETITAETKKAAEAMTDRVKNLMGDVSTRAKTAYEKGTEMVSQATEFSKGNVEALVESSKIAAKGAQDMGQTYAEDTKKTFEEMTAALKEFTTVKSPTEFIELQSKLVRKTFDTAVAQTSKNSEAFLKLAGDVIQPISNRVSVAVDSFKKAA
ncbi:phasin family protein [Blastomonas aquatica]|uniref:Phasin domain-containing protein n=1 Tax=Blastomonas aquatica TaxID=1510276 RepID=A0ABQ1JNZ4_9SPHN|nr:phasin family protein [Blastomonas aquatica]GGB73164.1 hypothetical protein GCM10010833_30470 [Blastomonas aquatica]